MATIKLHIDDFKEDDYHLIAIHTSLEDYRLAYFLNRDLFVFLSKSNDGVPVQVKEGKTFLERFTFDDEENYILWNLVQNKNEIEGTENNQAQDLFSNSNNSFSSSAYLLPEYKKVDFFLKIENAEKEINIAEIVSKISAIDKVNLVYAVDAEKIKSKNNLIF